jgi:adenosylhomocysteine nucleosidase
MIEHDGRRYRLFEHDGTALICGGIGAQAARRATEAVIVEVQPEIVVSAGFAGSLDHSLKVGQIFEPGTVINSADGVRTQISRTPVESCAASLVTATAIAGNDQKARLAKAYGAQAVDMEAAAVAQGAQARSVAFGALKAISDDFDFNLPDMNPFVTTDGSFRTLKFVSHVALRPWLWASTVMLARNSSKASHALCNALVTRIRRSSNEDDRVFSAESFAPMLNPTKDGSKYAGGHTRAGIEVHTEGK